MKKCILATMVIGLALLCAAPVMALDVDFSGEFRLRGINHDNIALSDPKSASQAYYDSRARIKTTFKVNDNISFITRFDALDNRKLGTDNSSSTAPNYQDYEDIQFDTAYTIIKTPFGAFIGGRIVGGLWGPSGMGDSNLQSKDRLMWYVPVDKLSFGGYLEKSYENDSTGYAGKADADNDKYTVFVQHKGETFQAGLLCSLYDFRAFPAMKDFLPFKKAYNDYLTAQSNATTARATFDLTYAGTVAAAGVAAAQTALVTPGSALANAQTAAITAEAAEAQAGLDVQAGAPNIEAKAYILDPYVSGNFGPFSYFGELIYAVGDGDYENQTATQTTIDVDAMQYHVEGKFKFGPGAVRGGYWFMSGDNNTDDNEMNSIGYIENNRDMDIALILTGDPHELGTYNALGGLGNFSADTQALSQGAQVGTTAMAGGKILYLGVGFDVMENLNLDFSWANAKVDKPPGTNTYDVTTGANYTTDWNEEVGNEYDFKLTWTPMENLEYKIHGGYLDAGDYWKKGNATAQIENMYTLFHALTVTF